MKVLIINQCATNKGDRAVLFLVLKELERNGLKDIVVSTTIPKYWEDNPDVPDMEVKFVPWGWGPGRKKNPSFLDKVTYRIKSNIRRRIIFPIIRNALLAGKKPGYISILCNKEYLNALDQSDIVISTGGHHVTTIIAGCMATGQILDMALALIYDKPLLLWSQSIGTFDFKDPKNKLMVQKILSEASQIFIRDIASELEIKKLGVSVDHVHKTRESVFGLYELVKARIKPSEREAVMGLSVWTGRKADPKVRQHYIDSLVMLVNHAIDAGYKILFFPMELEGYDLPFLRDIMNNCQNKQRCKILEDWPNTTEHINALSRCRIFTGHKTHSVIFSLTTATPLVAIAYHKKTVDFMTQFGIEDYAIPEENLTGSRLIEIFDNVNSNLDAINQKEEQTALRFSRQVVDDFAKMIEQSKKLISTGREDISQ